jgi:leucyl aminopeptidase
MKIEFIPLAAAGEASDALAILAFDGGVLSPGAEDLDKATGGAVGRAIAASRFKGKAGQTLDLLAPSGVKAGRALIVGGGDASAFDPAAAEAFAAQAYQSLKLSGASHLWLMMAGASADAVAQAAFGARLAAYWFNRYRTKDGEDKIPSIERLSIVCDDPKEAKTLAGPLGAVAEGVEFTRDLVSEPANILYPEEFAKRVKKLEKLGLGVEVLGEKEMKKLGMGALLGVGQGSERESQLVVIQWKGAADKDAPPVAFVGKGVTFDTGGISLKPAEGMEDMKWDMGGAGTVAGLMCALAARKAKVNAVGILGLVENMPGGNAQRPGDIVTSYSGQTIEVLNTDAEGRLVLADALWYCQERFKPQFMIDLATLTGAIIVALGNDFAGLYASDDELAEKLLVAGKAEGEGLWRMPLPAAYDKMLDTAAADMKNITGGRGGGSITAAMFLKRFTNGVPWAHLDIAGVAWRKPSTAPVNPEGATGYGVRLLNRLVADNYEG